MDRMLVVVFDDQAKVHDGKNALLQLDSDGSISIYRYAVVAVFVLYTAEAACWSRAQLFRQR